MSSGTWPATVNMEGTYWNGDGASGHSSAGTSSGVSGTYTNMYTGLVEMSVSSLSSQYTFDGWATSAAASPSNTNATYSYYITTATTVYAYFTKKWTITFNKNGHGDESTPSTQYVAEGKKISAVSDLSEAGYTFGGWYTNEECTGSAWNFASNTVSEDITLYAKWTINDYDITYSPSPASHFTYTTAPSSATYATQVDFTFTPDANYVISTVTAVDGSSNPVTVTKVSENNYRIASMPASDIIVTVTPALSSITVYYGAGSNGSLAAKQGGVSIGASGSTVDGGSTVNFTATPDTYYEVEGWYETYSGGVFSDKIDAAGTSTTYNPIASSTLNVYVKFKLIDYTITYTLNGGTNSGSNPATYTYETATITLQDPTRNYYTFAGWYTSSTFTAGTEITSIPLHSSGAKQIYAKWTENMTTINLVASPTGAGTFTIGGAAATSTTAGKSTTRSVTAVAATGYYVKTSSTVWSKSNSNITLSSTTANPTIVTGCGTAGTSSTLTATFTEKYLLCGSINADGNPAGGMRGWSTSGDNSAYQSAVYNNGVLTIQANLTSAATQYKFKLYNQQGSAWKGQSNEGGSMSDGAQWTFNGTYDVYFTTTVAGVYTFTIDQLSATHPRVRITFPGEPEHSATLAVHSSGHGTTTPAAGSITLKEVTTTTITANPEPGYRFKQWNVTGSCAVASTTSATTTATASGDGGRIEAEFTQDGMIYFDNTMSQWKGDIYVYIFTMDKSTRDPWWNSKDGSGNGPGIVLKKKDGTVMYQYYGKMTRIGESNIYYFNYHAAGCSSTIYQVVFTKGDYHESAGLYQTSAAYRSDFNSCFPMYLASQSWTTTNSTGYHSSGYWKRYNVTNSGFSISGLNSDWTTHYEFTAASANSNTFKATVHLSNNTHSFKIFRCSGSELGNNGTMTPSSHSGWEMTPGTNNCQIEAPSGGDYEFTINIGTDHIYLSVEYPLLANDYHLLYVGRITTDGSDSHRHPSQSIRHLTGSNKTQHDTVSFFIDKDHKGTLKLQKCTNPASYGGTGAWADSAAVTVNLSSISETGIYNFEIIQTTNAAGKRTVTAALLDAAHRKYNGELYIRTDMADGGWEAYKEVDNNKLVYSDYAKAHSGYDYYHCHWSSTGTNVHFTIANQYSPSITDTMKQGATPFNFDNLPYQASTRFMYNSATNKISRAYINGSSEEGEATYLWLQGTSAGTSRILNTSGSPFTDNKEKFGDDGNWIYRIDIKAEEAARIKLICNYRFSNTDHLQYFKGTSADWSNTSTEEILGGTSTSEAHPIRVIYDFKTNHLISAWLADGTNVNEPKAINTSVMVVREHQEDAKQITFTSTGKLTSVDTVYCVMQFNKWTINNKSKTGAHPALSPSLSTHERGLYWVSFPFNVKLNDVFGFGEYGTNWIIEYYDGKGRAEKGFWAESPVNWKFVDPSERATYVLKANEGYVLALDLETMTESSKVWEYVENVSLYFPSSTAVGNIIKKDVSVTIDQTGYECTINRTVDANNNPTGLPADYDRRKRDSYWHCIGVPSFANNTHDIKDDAFIKDVSDEYYYPSTWSAANLPFYYKWDPATNAISPYSTGSSLEFKAMNSYLVQYSGTSLSWSSVTTPSASSVVGRKAKMEDIHFAEFKLELMQGEESVDHTFVRLTDNEEATKEFEFGQDLCKEFNKKSNIYTLIGDLQVAGNSMPLEYEKTTLVPVGVKIVAEGEYSFSLPEGTSGVGVTLIDNELQTRTNLALTDYAVTLPAGTYDERFVLEISPIEQTTTNVEAVTGDGLQVTGVCKKLIDGVLYIVKDGKVFDARGARIQ